MVASSRKRPEGSHRNRRTHQRAEEKRPVWKNYSKSAFTDTQKSFLNNNTDVAIARAKDLRVFHNPSTGIYKLIEMLQNNTK